MIEGSVGGSEREETKYIKMERKKLCSGGSGGDGGYGKELPKTCV